jgi:hypothetical protein
MARRRVHYEAAFEDFLRSRATPYVAVDEAKRTMLGQASIKSFDFVVYSPDGPNLLVDVKGRKFPDSAAGRSGGTRAWENWITQEDVEGLGDWEAVFGEGFLAMLVFVYWLQGPPRRAPFEDVHLFGRKYYAFMAMPLQQYVARARPRSRKWKTLSIPSVEFSAKAHEIGYFL